MSDMFPPDEPDDADSFLPWYTPEDPIGGRWDDRWDASLTGEPFWWDDEHTLWNDQGNPITLTGEDWFDLTLEYDELTYDQYGMSVLDIIHQLEDQGLWDAEDWDYWRENYG